jgi:hypothetical protein
MIADHYRDKFWPNGFPKPHQLPDNWPNSAPGTYTVSWPEGVTADGPTKEEFDALKKEVEDMKALLKKAKKYDEENNQPDCEMDEKVALLKKLAEAVGIDLEDALPANG